MVEQTPHPEDDFDQQLQALLATAERETLTAVQQPVAELVRSTLARNCPGKIDPDGDDDGWYEHVSQTRDILFDEDPSKSADELEVESWYITIERYIKEQEVESLITAVLYAQPECSAEERTRNKKMCMAIALHYGLDYGSGFGEPGAYWSDAIDVLLEGEPLDADSRLEDAIMLYQFSEMADKDGTLAAFRATDIASGGTLTGGDYQNVTETIEKISTMGQFALELLRLPTSEQAIASNHIQAKALFIKLAFNQEQINRFYELLNVHFRISRI